MSDIYHDLLSGDKTWTPPDHWPAAQPLGIINLDGECQISSQAMTVSLLPCTMAIVSLDLPLSIASRSGTSLVVSMPLLAAIPVKQGIPFPLPPLEASLLVDVFLENARRIEHQQSALGLVCHQLSDRKARDSHTGGSSSLFDTLIDYMTVNLDMPLTLEMLSTEFSISVSHITKLFQAEKDESPMAVLANLRIKHAKQLLAETELTVSQIGHSVGYKTVSGFSRFFKKQTNQSPKDFRENVQWLV